MAWPDRAAVKAAYVTLASTALDGKIDRFLIRAINRIKGALAGRYDVAGWDATTPQVLYDLALDFTACYVSGPATHTGDKLTATDQSAMKQLETLEADLKRYATGAWPILDAASQRIPAVSGKGAVHLRTTEPIFTMRGSESQRVRPPDADDDTDWKITA